MASSMCYNVLHLCGNMFNVLYFCGNSEEDGILKILLGFKRKYYNIVTSFFFVQLLMGEI